MKIVCVTYREWANKIYEKLFNKYLIIMIFNYV